MIQHQLPTGYLFTDQYEKGQLETLSIGDYGKAHNIKADFLGHTKDLSGVENAACMPLQEKWVVTLSTQYGCPMKCTFCDVPKLQFRGNVSEGDLRKQLYSALALFPDVRYTDRLNIHFARMGDPIFNKHVFQFTRHLQQYKQQFQDDTGVRIETLHPVLTTSLPRKFKHLANKLEEWTQIKNWLYRGQAGLQLSINSTCNKQRHEMFQGLSLTLEEVADMVRGFTKPLGRKYCLNFALADNYEVDASKLASLFDPEAWMCKITPIHNNNACKENGIKTSGGYQEFYPYQKAETDLKAAGFDTLVFVPSMDEEDGLVTCGNAVLSGREVTTGLVNIRGTK